MAVIKPTVGRVVHFHGNDMAREQAALIAYVHSDTMLNLAVFDENGVSYGVTSVPLVQDGEDIPAAGPYATWMPYQVAVADGKIPPVLHATKEAAVPGDPAPSESEASGGGDTQG